jgi:hypothetical protein
MVTLTGELVGVQMKRKEKILKKEDFPSLQKKPLKDDIWQNVGTEGEIKKRST